MGFRRKSWIETGGTEKVEHLGSMRDEAVPDMKEEVGVSTTEAGDEVILVGLDGAFGSVGAMQVRRNKFETDTGIAQKLC